MKSLTFNARDKAVRPALQWIAKQMNERAITSTLKDHVRAIRFDRDETDRITFFCRSYADVDVLLTWEDELTECIRKGYLEQGGIRLEQITFTTEPTTQP